MLGIVVLLNLVIWNGARADFVSGVCAEAKFGTRSFKCYGIVYVGQFNEKGQILLLFATSADLLSLMVKSDGQALSRKYTLHLTSVSLAEKTDMPADGACTVHLSEDGVYLHDLVCKGSFSDGEISVAFKPDGTPIDR